MSFEGAEILKIFNEKFDARARLREKMLSLHRTFYLYLWMAALFLGLVLGATIRFGVDAFQKGSFPQDQRLIMLTELLGTSVAILLVVVTVSEGRRYRLESTKDRVIDHMRKKIEFYSLFKGKTEIMYAKELELPTFISNFESFMNSNNIEQRYMQWASSELSRAITTYFAFYYDQDKDDNEKANYISRIANIVEQEYKIMITRYLSFHSLN